MGSQNIHESCGYTHHMEFVSLMAAARRLDVSRTGAVALASAGLARTSRSTVDGTPVFDAPDLELLARRSPLPAPPSIPTIVVKLGPPGVDESGRKFGYHVDYKAREKADAARMYWRVAEADNAIGAAFVATVVGFVVLIAKISGVRHHPGGAVEFMLTDPPQEMLDIYQDMRIKTKPGGAMEYLGPWQLLRSEDITDVADADAAMDEPSESVSLKQVEKELGTR